MSIKKLLGLWLLAVLVAIGSGFASLWQFERHDARSQASQIISEISAQSPINLDAPTSNVDEFRRIEMTGSFTGQSVLIRNRPLEGRNGFWLISKFRTTLGYEYPTLVGWFPATQAASAIVEIPVISSTQMKISGISRKLEPAQNANDLPKGQYLSVDKALFDTNAGFFVQVLSADKVVSDQLKYVPIPNTSQGPHLFYAWQWLIFGAIALIGAVWFTKQEKSNVKSERS
jgi:cytochrome oxidase assembly protein ShyY1